ncbi:hypothetical protein Thivi_1538 [Thiocystis violascens DSM 198]|uniref:Uncharacterized protein n=2 Tax=Thiocystis violascens TaxID=73141 RepID=I3Y962_THIV6|nr:hypothetical protein Thivi_1538 [Thiocystis violascens DSM 198]
MIRHVETLFCDDIRHEIGGKISYIGVYSGGLFVPAFPVTLPKLCLSVRILTPANDPLQSLTLRVLKDEETLQEVMLDEGQLAAASDAGEDATDERREERIQMTQFMLVFSPIQFDEPCILKVRAQTESEALRGMALKVDQLPSTFVQDLPPSGS